MRRGEQGDGEREEERRMEERRMEEERIARRAERMAKSTTNEKLRGRRSAVEATQGRSRHEA